MTRTALKSEAIVSIGSNSVSLTSSGVARSESPGVVSTTRVLIYSHDTYGLGHFRRCLKIAGEIRRQSENASVLLLSGSPSAHQFGMPEGVDFVKLPAVFKTGSDEYQPRSLRISIHDLVAMRSRIICESALSFHPDVILVDHAPLGLRHEAVPMLVAMREQSSRPAMILGLRDIIDEPARIVDQWQEEKLYTKIDGIYDRVIIYGLESMYDTCTAYRFPAGLRAKTHYAGFISDSTPIARPANHASENRRQSVLVTVGGGEDGGQIVETYISMIRRYRDHVHFDSILLPGPLLADSRVMEIQQASDDLPITVHHFVADLLPLLSSADLVVSMAGYNAVAEILAHAQRALFIPREWPRQEQLIRAERVRATGHADMIRISDLNEDLLWARVQAALASSDAPLARIRRELDGAFDGASRVAATLLQSQPQRQNRESGR